MGSDSGGAINQQPDDFTDIVAQYRGGDLSPPVDAVGWAGAGGSRGNLSRPLGVMSV
jgi:hypothetical protein